MTVDPRPDLIGAPFIDGVPLRLSGLITDYETAEALAACTALTVDLFPLPDGADLVLKGLGLGPDAMAAGSIVKLGCEALLEAFANNTIDELLNNAQGGTQ
jgi:hypothetical protein